MTLNAFIMMKEFNPACMQLYLNNPYDDNITYLLQPYHAMFRNPRSFFAEIFPYWDRLKTHSNLSQLCSNVMDIVRKESCIKIYFANSDKILCVDSFSILRDHHKTLSLFAIPQHMKLLDTIITTNLTNLVYSYF